MYQSGRWPSQVRGAWCFLPGSSCFIWGEVKDPPFGSTVVSPIDDEGEVDIEVAAEVDPVELCESADGRAPFVKVELPLCRVGNIRGSDSSSPDKVLDN